MKKIGGHRTSVEMAVENRKIVPFDRRGCGSLVSMSEEGREWDWIGGRGLNKDAPGQGGSEGGTVCNGGN